MRRRRFVGLAVAASIACGAFATSFAPPAGSSTSSAGERPARAQSADVDGGPAIGFPVRTVCAGIRICPGDHSPAWSPDGRRIAFVRGFDLVIAQPDGRAARAVSRGVSPFWSPAWSPDGRVLLVVCHPHIDESPAWLDARLCTIDADGPTGQRPKQITRSTYGGVVDRPVGWSPDGSRIAFVREAPYYLGSGWCCQLWVVDADGSNPILFGGGPPLVGGARDEPTYGGAAWSPDGRLAFYAGSADRGYSLWVSAANGTDGRLIAERAFGATWSRDGRLAFHVVNALWVFAADGTGRRLISANAPGRVIGWSPDSRRLFLHAQPPSSTLASVSVIEIDDAQSEPKVLRTEPYLDRIQLSPTGDQLVFVESGSGRIVLLDAAGNRPPVLVEGVSRQVEDSSRPTWSPDGARLLYVSDRGCPALLGLYSIRADGRGDRQLTWPCRIEGTPRGETLVGTGRTDGIHARGGADRIRAGAAADLVDGGAGADAIEGGQGDDRLYGGTGRDAIDGGPGWDAIVSRDRFADRIRCGPGTDIVWADRLDVVSRDCERLVRR